MKIAVVGLGRMGHRHVEAARLAGGTVVGICDSNSRVLASAGSELELRQEARFSDARQMIEGVRPDCIIIATTAPSHAPLTVLAAEQGVPMILCEKPMATSLGDCDRMIGACARTGARLAINHQMRYVGHARATAELLQSGLIGSLQSMTVIAGNFGLAMNGSHRLELFGFLTGEKVRSVTGWLSEDVLPNPRGAEFEDRAGSLRAITSSGRRLYIEAGPDQGHGIVTIFGGAAGQIIVDELNGEIVSLARHEDDRSLPTARYATPSDHVRREIGPSEATAPTVSLLHELFAGGAYPTGESGRAAIEALVAAWVSSEEGSRSIDLDAAALPLDRRFPWA